jgi:hypothetical protein
VPTEEEEEEEKEESDCDWLVICGLQGNFSPKFFLAMRFSNLDPAE